MKTSLNHEQFVRHAANAQSLQAMLLRDIADVPGEPFRHEVRTLIESERGLNVLGVMAAMSAVSDDTVPTEELHFVVRTERIINDWQCLSIAAGLFLPEKHPLRESMEIARKRLIHLFPAKGPLAEKQ